MQETSGGEKLRQLFVVEDETLLGNKAGKLLGLNLSVQLNAPDMILILFV